MSLNDKFSQASLIYQPHDNFFKQSMKEIGIARDFFKAYLPAEIYDQLDIKTLRTTDHSYVNTKLSAAQSDIVYACQIKASPGYIPILFLTEHQSTPDPHMAFKLLKYTIHLMTDHLTAGHDTLPIVLPLCVYHGKVSPYPYSRDIYDDFADPSLARTFVFKPFGLIDLTSTPTETLEQHGLAAQMQILLQQLKEKKWIRALKQLAKKGILQVTTQNTPKDYLITTLTYVLFQERHRKDAPSELMKILTDAIPEREREIMTFAQEIKQEGVEMGIKQGMQQGMYRLRQHAKKLLQKGIDYTSIEDMTGLSKEEIELLKAESL